MSTRFAASLFFSTATLSLTLSACSMGGQDKVAQAAGTALGIDTTALDKTVKPGDDFNLYANNSWVKRTEIPDDRSSMGGFTAADILTEKQLSDLISDVTKGDPSPDSDSGRVKALYASFLDTKTIDSAGMGPMKADLDRFTAITDVKSLSKVLGEQLRADVDPFNNTNFNTYFCSSNSNKNTSTSNSNKNSSNSKTRIFRKHGYSYGPFCFSDSNWHCVIIYSLIYENRNNWCRIYRTFRCILLTKKRAYSYPF